MKLLLVLSGLLIADAKPLIDNEEEKPCEGIIINDIYHDKEVLKTDLDRPYLLAVDYSTNTLYFSYSVNTDDDVFKTARLNLNTKEFTDIEGVPNGFAQTVDQKTHEIYIGGSEGIYKYNHNTNKAEFFGEKDTNIWNIYFKDILYFSTFPSQFFYTLVDGTASRFKDLEDTKVDHFVIDNEDEEFFTNATGLYSQKKGTKDAVLYQKFPNTGVRGLATDINGNAYVCLQDGVYIARKLTTSLERVVEIDDAFGLAFDNDNNIVYSDATKLVRLKPNKDKIC